MSKWGVWMWEWGAGEGEGVDDGRGISGVDCKIPDVNMFLT